jgi:hypothetical protein
MIVMKQGAFSATNALHLVLLGVSHRDAKALHARAAEFQVVPHKVEMGFGTDKNAVGHVKLQASAYVRHEVIAAAEISATAEGAAGKEGGIETDALNSNASLQLTLNSLAQFGGVNRVEVVKERTVRLLKDVQVLVHAPTGRHTYPKAFLEEKISAQGRICAAADGLGKMVDGDGRERIAIGCRLAGDGAYTECHIQLLGLNCAGRE